MHSAVAAAPNVRRISDYGFIGNCRSAALVSVDGSIDWLCLPRFDSDSLFCSILDPQIGGKFSIAPSPPFRTRHSYVHGTNVLKTCFHTQCGSVELLDCFTVTDEQTKRKSLWPDHEILRKLRCTRGKVTMHLVFYPTREHGLSGLKLQNKPGWGITATNHPKLLILRSDLPQDRFRIEANAFGRDVATAEFEISEGEEFWFSILFENDEPALLVPLGEHAQDRFDKTIRYWRNWISRCRYDGPYREQVLRSALALKLMVFAPSGAIIAAPTTSLPEGIGGTRNWDYRFCWLRDASFTVRVLLELGYVDEARSYVSWLLHSTRLTRKPWHARLQVLYNVYGEKHIRESPAVWLRGYRDSRPVRIGNSAIEQFQLDIYGEVIHAIRLIAPYLGSIDRATRNFVIETARAITELWDKPDEGIWEPRSGRAHHTHSKALAWVGLTSADWLIGHYGWKTRHDFRKVAREIRDAIETRGFNKELGAYTQTFEGNTLDSSLLLLPVLGYCDPKSPRITGTIAAIQKNLTHNGLVYRYERGSDGIRESEGAFGICNFWMAEALFLSGRTKEGHQWFQNLLNREAHEIGLWSEEIDARTGEYLGNYPQAFSHVGLINAAVTCGRGSLGEVEKTQEIA